MSDNENLHLLTSKASSNYSSGNRIHVGVKYVLRGNERFLPLCGARAGFGYVELSVTSIVRRRCPGCEDLVPEMFDA